jgi:membrane protein required for colicin V production
MIGPFTYLDAALLIIALLSGLLAMYRGLTRELLSLVSWAVAAGAVLYFVFVKKQLAEDIASQISVPVVVAQIGVGALLFVVLLVVVHLITSRISESILESGIGLIDRVLGFAFGIVRGFVLIVIPYMFYTAFVQDADKQVPWVRDARSLPYVKGTGEAFKGLLIRYMPASLTNPGGDNQQQG